MEELPLRKVVADSRVVSTPQVVAATSGDACIDPLLPTDTVPASAPSVLRNADSNGGLPPGIA
jgi:hypothetical protein